MTEVRRQRSREAASHIRGLIMSGEFRPGDTVRAESIGELLGISATPAREALQALRVEGFLELVPNHGFLVAPLNGDDIRDLFSVQGLIAGELASRAATRATDAQLRELEALHYELIAAAARDDRDSLEQKNHAFHRELNRIAGSRKIVWALGLMTRYVPHRFYSDILGWPEATQHDHSALIERIRARDEEGAREAMHSHITHAGELLAEYFDARSVKNAG